MHGCAVPRKDALVAFLFSLNSRLFCVPPEPMAMLLEL
jgi:hypothetical protein